MQPNISMVAYLPKQVNYYQNISTICTKTPKKVYAPLHIVIVKKVCYHIDKKGKGDTDVLKRPNGLTNGR